MNSTSTDPNAPSMEDEIMDMGALLDSGGAPEPRSLRRGEVVEGVVMGNERDGVLVDLVDIGSKSEGVIPSNEMHSLGADPASRLTVGEKVLVYVVQPETNEGQVLLSIDRARGEQGWRVLQQRFEDGDIFEGEVTGYNKGGLLANVEGVNAFIPMSQVVGAKPGSDGAQSLSDQVGRSLRLKVIEINRRRNRAILSERAALQEWRSEQKDRLLDELKEGEIRTGRITSIRNFGVFVDLGGADGLAHLSELSWDRNANPEERFKVGEEVKVYVMKVDQETKKIALSIRRAAPEQWQDLIAKYSVGDVVPGVVTKLVAFGAFTRLPGPVEGLVHVSELVDRRISHPQEVVDEGDVVPLKIVRIEHDRHRLGLSLRDARQEAEMRGWRFDDQGRVMTVSDEATEAFPEEVRAVEARLEARKEEAATRIASPPRRDESSDGGGSGPARRERDDAPPMTAMAAAMQQAQERALADENVGSAPAEAEAVSADLASTAAETAPVEATTATEAAEAAVVEPSAEAAPAETAPVEAEEAAAAEAAPVEAETATAEASAEATTAEAVTEATAPAEAAADEPASAEPESAEAEPVADASDDAPAAVEAEAASDEAASTEGDGSEDAAKE